MCDGHETTQSVSWSPSCAARRRKWTNCVITPDAKKLFSSRTRDSERVSRQTVKQAVKEVNRAPALLAPEILEIRVIFISGR